MDSFIHPDARVQTTAIGPGTRIWQFVVVLEQARIGADCNLNAHVLVENDVVLGDRVTVKSGVQLWDGLRVEDDVFIGPNVTFTNDLLPRSRQRPPSFRQTRLGKGCSIGANSTILCGITIGEGAMIGAGSLVTHDVPPFELCYGHPARRRGRVDAAGRIVERVPPADEMVEREAPNAVAEPPRKVLEKPEIPWEGGKLEPVFLHGPNESLRPLMISTDPIPLNSLRRHFQPMREDIAQALSRVVDSGWYLMGEATSWFQSAFAHYCGVAHGIGLANGTDALEIGLKAIGMGPGSRIATVANAGFYGTTALLAIGAVPVFIDVDPNSHLMDLEQLRRRLEAEPIDGVLVTHLYGRLHDMDALLALTDPRGIPVLEDCAQAHGAERGGRMAGSFGRAAAFSFYPTKNLGAMGDAGMLVTNDDAVADKAHQLRQYGWDRKYQVTTAGGRNSRMDEIQATVLAVQFPYLDSWNHRRRTIAARYGAGIRSPRLRLPEAVGAAGVAHLYVVVCDDRDGLRQHLSDHFIGCEIHYPIPDHRQPAWSGAAATLPVTEALAASVLTLPCFPELTDPEVDRVIACVNSW